MDANANTNTAQNDPKSEDSENYKMSKELGAGSFSKVRCIL